MHTDWNWILINPKSRLYHTLTFQTTNARRKAYKTTQKWYTLKHNGELLILLKVKSRKLKANFSQIKIDMYINRKWHTFQQHLRTTQKSSDYYLTNIHVKISTIKNIAYSKTVKLVWAALLPNNNFLNFNLDNAERGTNNISAEGENKKTFKLVTIIYWHHYKKLLEWHIDSCDKLLPR